MKTLITLAVIFLSYNSLIAQGMSDAVLISDFKVLYKTESDNAVIMWVTVSEKSNEGFVIESRKGNSHDFEFEAYIDGKGSTEHGNEYIYIIEDADLKHEFRVKQISYNGKIEYFYPQEFISGK